MYSTFLKGEGQKKLLPVRKHLQPDTFSAAANDIHQIPTQELWDTSSLLQQSSHVCSMYTNQRFDNIFIYT